MSSLLSKLEIEHQSEHQPILKKLFTTPTIYPKCVTEKNPDQLTAKQKKDILKKYPRWYVRYKYRDPVSGRLVRQANIYKRINREFPDYNQRLKHILILRDRVEHFLKNGYSPYKDNAVEEEYSAESAIRYALKVKEKELTLSTFQDYQTRADQFIKYLKSCGLANVPIKTLVKADFTKYLNYIFTKSSARNRNNVRSVLSAIFTTLEREDLIASNPVVGIHKLKNDSKPSAIYSSQSFSELISYVKDHDPVLHLFLSIVSYNFLRPIEVCRLRIEDVDLDEMRLRFKAKNKSIKYKRIPDILKNDFSILKAKFDQGLVISLKMDGVWDADEKQRRNLMGKRFAKVRNHFKLSSDYKVYSFRHTFITNLHKQHLKMYNESEALEKTRLCTGHDTIKALNMYLHKIDAVLADDYSDLVEIK